MMGIRRGNRGKCGGSAKTTPSTTTRNNGDDVTCLFESFVSVKVRFVLVGLHLSTTVNS